MGRVTPVSSKEKYSICGPENYLNHNAISEWYFTDFSKGFEHLPLN